MLRDDIKAIILDRLFDMSQGAIDKEDLPDILADEISLMVKKLGKRFVIIANGKELSYTPQDRNSEDQLRKILNLSNIGFAETDDAIIIGKSF